MFVAHLLQLYIALITRHLATIGYVPISSRRMERARIRDGFHIDVNGVYQIPYFEWFLTPPLGWPAPSIVVRSRPSPGARALPILS